MADVKLAFFASKRPEAQQALPLLAAKYGNVPEEEADVVVLRDGSQGVNRRSGVDPEQGVDAAALRGDRVFRRGRWGPRPPHRGAAVVELAAFVGVFIGQRLPDVLRGLAGQPAGIGDIGPVVGTHAGRGTIGIEFQQRCLHDVVSLLRPLAFAPPA